MGQDFNREMSGLWIELGLGDYTLDLGRGEITEFFVGKSLFKSSVLRVF